MSWFTLEPRDTLMVRDGRAMNGTVGRTLSMPHPPTLAGLVRTRLGSRDGRFDPGRIESLLARVSCAGPLLARLDATGAKIEEVFTAAPSDCIWFRRPDAVARRSGEATDVGHRLTLRTVSEIAPGATTDLGGDALFPGFVDPPAMAKPCGGPRYWSWSALVKWLAAPPATLDTAGLEVGIPDFERERRTQLAVDGATLTASDGALFMTEGLRLSGRARDGRAPTRWALLARVESGDQGELQDGLATLGGERSVAHLQRRIDPVMALPGRVKVLARGARARVILITPGIFAEGAGPSLLAGARVLGRKVDRPEVVSGWDFKAQRPKPTRRMAPAGSVYWVEVPDDGWAARTWLTCVSTSEQDNRDGFGLAVVGVGE